MMKTQIGLGVLSLPNVLITLGIVPGILCLIAMVRGPCALTSLVRHLLRLPSPLLPPTPVTRLPSKLQAIITGWSNYVIGAFKRRHPEVCA